MSFIKKLPNDEKITCFWSNWQKNKMFGVIFDPKTPIFSVSQVMALLLGYPVTNPKNRSSQKRS